MKRVTSLLLFLILGGVCVTASANELDDYLKKPHEVAKWQKVRTRPTKTEGVVITEVNVTSQKWRDFEWTHLMRIVHPKDGPKTDLALMIISGSGRRETALASEIVKSTGGCVAVLNNVPFQPLWGFREDDLIAHTFLQFVKSGDSNWPLLIPMTRSAVYGLDVLQQFSTKNWSQPLKRFVVSGGSKRGWTTWLTGIVDPRVVGIVPIVYDNLNLSAQMKYQVQHWGDFSLQIKDYTRRGLPRFDRTKKGLHLGSIVDPWAYRDRPQFKNIPKLLINATNDDYWPVDAMKHYIEDLGPNVYRLYVANQRHGIRDADRVVSAIQGFVSALREKKTFVAPTWKVKETGRVCQLIVSSTVKPAKVEMWSAYSKSRDMRPARWIATELKPREDQTYKAILATPAKGAKAMFVEVHYNIDGRKYSVTTDVKLLTDLPLHELKEQTAKKENDAEKPGKKQKQDEFF